MTRPADPTATGAITTNTPGAGNTVAITTNGLSSVGAQVAGTWTGTLTFEGTVDGTNWVAIGALPVATGTTAVTTTTGNGIWFVNCAGLAQVRLRGSAAITGSATVTLIGSALGTA